METRNWRVIIVRSVWVFFLIAAVQSNFCYSQKSIKNLQLDASDFAVRKVQFDSTANAVIIFDSGETTFDNSGCRMVVHRRIKFLSKKGLNDWGKIVAFYPRGATSKIDAAIFNLVGGKVERTLLNLDFAFESSYDKYTDRLVCVFPNLRIGSIVEYEYTIKYWGSINPDWNFQHTIPVLRSEYKVFYPISNGLTSVLLGTHPMTFSDKTNDGRDYRWLMTNLPPFKAEPLMPYENQYRSTIKFWGYNESWASTCGKLVDHEAFWGIVSKSFELNKVASELTSGIRDDSEKIKRIVQYVKEKVEWNRVQDFYGTWPKKLLEDKRGSSGDINLMLASLLQKAGFKVSVILLTTKDRGFVLEEVPSATQFNYVLCHVKIDSKDVFLDATDRFLPYNLIPSRCTNTKGLRIDEDKYEWIDILSPSLSKTIAQFDLLVNEPTSKAKIVLTNYLAARSRKSFPLKNEFNIELQNCSSENENEVDAPLKVGCEFDTERMLTRTEKMIYITPVFSHKIVKNDFLRERSYPIDFVLPVDETVVFSFAIPEGYQVEEILPAKILSLSDQAMKYSVSTLSLQNKIIVTSNFRINRTTFEAGKSSEIREFHNAIIDIQSKQIVLKKK